MSTVSNPFHHNNNYKNFILAFFFLILSFVFIKARNLEFSSPGSQIIINPRNSYIKISNPAKVTGWEHESIIKNSRVNPGTPSEGQSSSWANPYSAVMLLHI